MRTERIIERNDPDLVSELVTENFKLAHFFANRARDLDPDQALSLAMDGLQSAAELWDGKKGKFSTYASITIKSKFGGYRLYLSREKRGGRASTVSLNDFVGQESETELQELIADDAADTIRPLLLSDDAKLFRKGMRRLSERERYVIKCRFGIDDTPQTLEQVGVILKVSRERVRQIEEISLVKLRRFIEKTPRHRTAEDKSIRRIRGQQWYKKNKRRISEKAKRHYQLFSAIIKARVHQWYSSNHERAIASKASYRALHREALAAAQLNRYYRRYKDDPLYKLKVAISRAVNRPRQRAYSANRSREMTDGYIRELLSKSAGRPSFTFTSDEITAKRNKVLNRRSNPICPRCGIRSARSGMVNGRQRFICYRKCKRTFCVA